MAEKTRAGQSAKVVKEYGIEVLEISETRWKGTGSVTLQSGEKVVYVENDEVQQGGVAIMMRAALMEWTILLKVRKLTRVQACASTNDAMDKEKDEFYNQLQDTVSSCNRNDMIVVMGDLNAKVGNNNTNRGEVMGKFGFGVVNDGERLCDFCSANGFIITGTIFPHKDIHKLTWRSPDGRTVNPIDHVLVNGNMRTSVLDTRVMRGTDVYSDHYLVKMRIRLKLARAQQRRNVRERFDISKLQSEEIRRRYNTEVRNRFEALGDIDDPEEEHDMILATHRDAAKKVLGRSKMLSRPWIGSKMWEKIKKRKEAKFKLEGARSERLKQRWREEYNAKNKEVKRSAREDNRNWLENRAAEVEKAAENGRSN